MGIFQALTFIFFVLLFILAVVYAITFLLHRRHAHKMYQEVEKLHKNLVDLISAHNEIVDVLEQI